MFLWQAFILFLPPAFTASIFVSIFFSVNGALIRNTCRTYLIEEGFSTMRQSYFEESTGSRRDQIDPTLSRRET